MESRTPAPPEAKLTPVRNAWDPLEMKGMERYGGEVGRPSFSAAVNKLWFINKSAVYSFFFLFFLF